MLPEKRTFKSTTLAQAPDNATAIRDRLPAICAAIAALSLYAITLAGTYIYDDLEIIIADPRLANVQLWKEFWTKDYFYGGPDNLYRPLVSMSYAVQVRMHGNSEQRAWAFHLVNWLLHAAVSAAIAELARRLAGFRVGLLAGLLFAAHPVHVEAVSNIVGRAELLCALGIVAALVLALHRPLTPGRALAIWACFLVALLCKEQGMLLPAALIALPLAMPPSSFARRGPILFLILLLTWTLAGYLFFRESILKFGWDRSWLDWTINPLVKSQGIDRVLMPLSVLGRYVAMLIAPIRLCFEYGAHVIGPHASWRDPFLYLGTAAALAWLSGIILCIRNGERVILFCLLEMAIFYSIISNALAIIGIGLAERLMYIPSIFFIIAVAALLTRLPRGVLVPFSAAILVLAAMRTVTYAWRFNDRLRMYETCLAQQPRSIRLHLMLGEELRQRRDFARAEAVLAEARDMQSDYWRSWMQSAAVALDAGDIDRAGRFFHRAAELHPTVTFMPLARLIQQRAATRPK
jgi:hypothetical protein